MDLRDPEAQRRMKALIHTGNPVPRSPLMQGLERPAILPRQERIREIMHQLRKLSGELHKLTMEEEAEAKAPVEPKIEQTTGQAGGQG